MPQNKSKNPTRAGKGNRWRPQGIVGCKVMGVCVHTARLLVMEVYNDRGRVKGARPLGGFVEFGETREQALKREFREELGTEIALLDDWRTYENIYTHAGKLGHEFLFGCSIALLNPELYTQERLVFSEDSGTENLARWISLQEFHRGAIELFPTGLLEVLSLNHPPEEKRDAHI